MIEARYLNAWREYENEEARRGRAINQTLRKARRLGIKDADKFMIRGDL